MASDVSRRCNMSGWKRKEKDRSVSTPIAASTDVLSPLEMYRQVTDSRKRKIKGVEGTVPFAADHTLIDLSLATKGNMEDRDFALDPMLRLNLRRGNTLAVVLDPISKGRFVEDSRVVMSKGIPYEITLVDWVRKGMRKFFDMCLPYVQQSRTQNLDGLGSFGGNFPKQYRGREEYMEELRKVIFFEVEQSLIRDKLQIDVYKTNKANGENAQVSYFPKIGAWIIASKNVSLAARTADDISSYSLSRYDFARLIALEWFRLIAPLTPSQLSNLQRDLTNRTIVGEYVGHQDHQHLVRYQNKDVMFYAYVDHQREDTCLPPVQAFRLFRKYGLSHVKVSLYGSYRSTSELYSALETLFMKTSSEDIIEGEEGSVLYFVRNSESGSPEQQQIHASVFTSEEYGDFPAEMEAKVYNAQQTLSLAKLKTLEYRIYRKLREKLKHYTGDKTAESILRVFKNEMRELCEGHELPHPSEFYHEIARLALQFISKNPRSQENLQDHYIDFLDKIIASVSNKSQTETDGKTVEIVIVTPPEVVGEAEIGTLGEALGYTVRTVKEWRENNPNKEKTIFRVFHSQKVSTQFDEKALIIHVGFTDAGKRDCLQALTRLSASGIRIENEEIQRFIETTDLNARIETLWNDVRLRSEHMSHKFPMNLVEIEKLAGAEGLIAQRIEEITQKTNAKMAVAAVPTVIPASPSTEKRVIVIMPMGIPGMGKTFLITQLQSLVSSLNSSLSVVSSDRVRRDCMDEWLRKNRNSSLDKAFDATAKRARSVFFDKLTGAMRSSSPIHMVFVDKNHPPNAVNGTLEEIQRGKPRDVRKVEVVALVPDCREQFRVRKGNGELEFEMSLTFLVQCMLRTRDRPDHETLIGSPSKLLSVVLMMFNLYRDTQFSSYTNSGFDQIIRVPFTDESPVCFPQPLISAISDLIAGLRPGSMPQEMDVRPIEEALKFIPNAFGKVENCEATMKAFAEIVRKTGERREEREEERREVDVVTERKREGQGIDMKKVPVFLGIDVERWFGPCLLGFLRSCLFSLSEIYEKDTEVSKDYTDLMENSYAPQFASGQQVSGSWAYPNSLHLTTKFIGGKRIAMTDPEISSFRSDTEVSLRVKMLAYVPRKLICILCEVLTPGITVENRFPHITCLLSGWKAKNSNDVLSSISFTAGVSKQRQSLLGEEVTVYTIRLVPEWIIKGITRAFYN